MKEWWTKIRAYILEKKTKKHPISAFDLICSRTANSFSNTTAKLIFVRALWKHVLICTTTLFCLRRTSLQNNISSVVILQQHVLGLVGIWKDLGKLREGDESLGLNDYFVKFREPSLSWLCLKEKCWWKLETNTGGYDVYLSFHPINLEEGYCLYPTDGGESALWNYKNMVQTAAPDIFIDGVKRWTTRLLYKKEAKTFTSLPSG